MIDSRRLLADLQKEVARLHADLRARCDADPAVDAPLRAQYDTSRRGPNPRTALTYPAWREEELTNVAVAWVLACVFIRFLEDNDLAETLWLAGPDAAGIGRARDQQIVFFREHPGLSEREYLSAAFEATSGLPGMAALFDRRHNPLWTVGPTGDAVRALLEFWRRADAETGRPVHDFHDEEWNTRFLGDLYQDLSEAARKRYALLQTPVFVEQFILDRTLTPAIETFGFREVRLIDPTCGSGHFLLGAFARLFALWNESSLGDVPSHLAQRALDQVYGVDLNPNVTAIARFRLLLAALRASGIGPGGERLTLRHAFDFQIHIATGDALLHGRRFREFDSHATERTFDTEEVFRDELKHHYEVEDSDALHRILGQQYHAVVGNPPYITVKDAALSKLYRDRYGSCAGKYSLSVPFMERFFDLATTDDGTPQQPAGYVGQITANSFMKREFGKKLIEKFLPRWDLTHVLDTSGAYIPGHGTPTVILFGRNQPPVSETIRTVLGINGEPATPTVPSKGLVWRAICQQIDQPGSVSRWVSVTDSPRANFEKHPWSIGGGGAAELKEIIEDASEKTIWDLVEIRRKKPNIGFASFTGLDEAFLSDRVSLRRAGVEQRFRRDLITGDAIRNWMVDAANAALVPCDENFRLVPIDSHSGWGRYLWPNRTCLRNVESFESTREEEGSAWWGWYRWIPEKYRAPLSVCFSEVATHNHFILDHGGKVFKQTAPVIKLKSEATEADHVRLLSVLNSSAGCFWLKQVCHNKGSTVDEHGARQRTAPFEDFYAFNGTKLASFPIPEHQPSQFSKAIVAAGMELQSHAPAAMLAKAINPDRTLADSYRAWHHNYQQMISWQEELDWQIYAAYSLVEAADNVSLLDDEAARTATPPINFGERAFEFVLARRMAAGEEQTTWFERHKATPQTDLPAHWPPEYRALVERRIARIADDANIRLIERPEYKRRWNTEPWDEQFARAARDWLLARLEGYFHEGERVCALTDGFDPAAAGFAPATRPVLATTNALAGTAQTDPAFLAVAEQFMGGPGFSVPKLVRELVESAAVPNLPAARYKPSGLLKRRDWESVWNLQRREDAIDAAERADDPGLPDLERARRREIAAARKRAEVGDIPVPPKYGKDDFRKPVWWGLRGKLDVPKERWVVYPGTERAEDPSAVIAWAGWDHAQQARALAEYYVDARQTFAFPTDKLALLLAGLCDLQPWLDQWHNATDPTSGANPAESIRGFVESECHTLGITRADLERMRMGG